MVKKADPLKRVKVVGNFRVVYGGTAYSGGDIIPDEVSPAVVDKWLEAGWVTEAE